MDITSFIPSQRQAILERFQQVEALGLGVVRIELKVANPVGASSMSVTLWQGRVIFQIKQWCPSVFFTKRTWTAFLWMSLTFLVAQVCLITSSY